MRRLLCLAILAGSVAAAVAADEPKSTDNATSASKPAGLDAEAEARALTMVRQNLPELAQVLEPLKATNALEYRKAITELATEAHNQSELRARNPARADMALEFWKARTRVELIAAQLSNSPSPERESQLHAAIEARVDVEIRRHKFELDQAEAAVKKIRENLARVEANRDRAKDALDRLEMNRETRIENRFKNLLPKPKTTPPTVTRPKAKSSANAVPAPIPAASLDASPVPSSRFADDTVPMPSPLVEGQTR